MAGPEIIDDRTEGRGYPLPSVKNNLDDDVGRIREAITTIDSDVSELEVLLLALGN